MRILRAGILVAVVVAPAATLAGSQDPVQSTTPQMSYAEFIELDPAARRHRFAEVNAETKASIMRSHISDWLTKHRARLSKGQVEVVQEAIEFVTPALYENPTDPNLKARTETLDARLACRLRRSDIMTAFKPSDPPMAATLLEDFSAWLTGCVLGW